MKQSKDKRLEKYESALADIKAAFHEAQAKDNLVEQYRDFGGLLEQTRALYPGSFHPRLGGLGITGTATGFGAAIAGPLYTSTDPVIFVPCMVVGGMLGLVSGISSLVHLNTYIKIKHCPFDEARVAMINTLEQAQDHLLEAKIGRMAKCKGFLRLTESDSRVKNAFEIAAKKENLLPELPAEKSTPSTKNGLEL